ncbi:MAG: hypothetical protein ACO1OG_10110 [Devosia sp.]
MSVRIAAVNGWEIHLREDRGFGVYDGHGLIAGPFATQQAAQNAARLLPRHRSVRDTVGPLEQSA